MTPALPNIGDIITFSDTWYRMSVYNNADEYITEGRPHGLVVEMYEAREYDLEEDWFFSTLAYPLMDTYSDSSMVYIVLWASGQKYIRETYRCINEEWFFQGLFIIASKAVR